MFSPHLIGLLLTAVGDSVSTDEVVAEIETDKVRSVTFSLFVIITVRKIFGGDNVLLLYDI